MTEPDEALLWARGQNGDPAKPRTVTSSYRAGLMAHGYRAGQAASAERIKALEEELAKANKPRWFYADDEGSPFDSAHEAVEWILDEFGPDDDFPNGKGVRRIDTMRDCAPIFAAVRCRRITEAERAGGRKGDFHFEVTECATEAEAEALLKEADQ